jgi:multidrug efflux pump subunit AcrB
VCAPRLVITVDYPGASPAEVEAAVVAPLEDALASLEGVRAVTSTASEGRGELALDVLAGADAAALAGAARARLATVKSLPADAERPLISVAPRGGPTAVLVLRADAPLSVLAGAAAALRDALERAAGIGRVAPVGLPVRRLVVTADAQRLRAYGLTAAAVAAAIGAPAAPPALAPGGGQVALRGHGDLPDLGALGGLVVSVTPGGGPVYLRDVAALEDALASAGSAAIFDGARAVALVVQTREPGPAARLDATVRGAMAAAELPDEVTLWSASALASPCGGRATPAAPTAASGRLVSAEVALAPGTSPEQAAAVAARLTVALGETPAGHLPVAALVGAAPLVGLAISRPAPERLLLLARASDRRAAAAAATHWDRVLDATPGLTLVASSHRPRVEALLVAPAASRRDEAAAAVLARLRAAGLSTAWVAPGRPQPQVSVQVDAAAAARLGVTAADVAAAARSAQGEEVLAVVAGAVSPVPVVLRVGGAPAPGIEALRRATVTTPAGARVPLSQVARLELGEGPPEILRRDRRRVTVLAVHGAAGALEGGVRAALGAALDAVRGRWPDVEMSVR